MRSVPVREGGDLVARLRVVGQDHDRRLPGDLLDDLGVGAGVVLVAGQHEPGGVGHAGLAQVGDPLVHRGDDVRHPLALGVQRGAPRRRLGALACSASDSDAAMTSPALLRQRDVPVYAAKTTGRTTPSRRASR